MQRHVEYEFPSVIHFLSSFFLVRNSRSLNFHFRANNRELVNIWIELIGINTFFISIRDFLVTLWWPLLQCWSFSTSSIDGYYYYYHYQSFFSSREETFVFAEPMKQSELFARSFARLKSAIKSRSPRWIRPSSRRFILFIDIHAIREAYFPDRQPWPSDLWSFSTEEKLLSRPV